MVLSRRQLGAAIVAVLVAGNAIADSHEPVALVVTGLSTSVEYTLAELAELGSESFETTTIWSDGVLKFTGVPLWALLKDLGVTDGQLLARAINDYAVEVPVSDAVENGPILAYQLNGERMTLRDKGPLWLVYPYDRNPEYRSEVIYSRSIWQLDRIEVLP